MGRTRWRLRSLERDAETLHNVLVLPDGSKVLYAPEEALGAVGAAIHGTEDALLTRFLDAGTTEGLPGLCLALTGSRVRG